MLNRFLPYTVSPPPAPGACLLNTTPLSPPLHTCPGLDFSPLSVLKKNPVKPPGCRATVLESVCLWCPPCIGTPPPSCHGSLKHYSCPSRGPRFLFPPPSFSPFLRGPFALVDHRSETAKRVLPLRRWTPARFPLSQTVRAGPLVAASNINSIPLGEFLSDIFPFLFPDQVLAVSSPTDQGSTSHNARVFPNQRVPHFDGPVPSPSHFIETLRRGTSHCGWGTTPPSFLLPIRTTPTLAHVQVHGRGHLPFSSNSTFQWEMMSSSLTLPPNVVERSPPDH